jgi:hypothetical protein
MKVQEQDIVQEFFCRELGTFRSFKYIRNFYEFLEFYRNFSGISKIFRTYSSFLEA